MSRPVYLTPYLKEPDFSRPLIQIPEEKAAAIRSDLEILYGAEKVEFCYLEIERLIRVHHACKPLDLIKAERSFDSYDRFTERDSIVITYGDVLTDGDKPSLEVLTDVLDQFLEGVVSTIHLLPFFPHTSDRGFSVTDYRTVDPALGTWEDIDRLGTEFRLMFDAVINHTSSRSEWFREFLNGNPEFQDFFITLGDQVQHPDYLRLILRPRTSDLWTSFRHIDGEKKVWTTFSRDQIDLNYKNERVLLKILDILLGYVRHGADMIRLDAATYLWWELGTSCANLRETHVLVRLIRAVFDVAAPYAGLVTETNVPHEENVRYFGDGTNEAHMVYNFALPPLVLHTFNTSDCSKLSEWASTLVNPSDTCTYLSLLDSHDGIGLLGARGILSEEEIGAMVQRTLDHGGLVSYRTGEHGESSPYELNITWFDALNAPGSDEPIELQIRRFMTSRAIALVLMGVPGIYLPSFTGSRLSPPADVAKLDEPRSINRRRVTLQDVIRARKTPQSTAFEISRRFLDLMGKRRSSPAFHPNAAQTVIPVSRSVFVLARQSLRSDAAVLTLTNVTPATQRVILPLNALGASSGVWIDILSGHSIREDHARLECLLDPYQVVWLAPSE